VHAGELSTVTIMLISRPARIAGRFPACRTGIVARSSCVVGDGISEGESCLGDRSAGCVAHLRKGRFPLENRGPRLAFRENRWRCVEDPGLGHQARGDLAVGPRRSLPSRERASFLATC